MIERNKAAGTAGADTCRRIRPGVGGHRRQHDTESIVAPTFNKGFRPQNQLIFVQRGAVANAV